MRACGLDDDDFEKPFIGIANSFTDIVPGHIHLRDLVEFVKEGIIAAGGGPGRKIPAVEQIWYFAQKGTVFLCNPFIAAQ